jgi:hypothetical protein
LNGITPDTRHTYYRSSSRTEELTTASMTWAAGL